MSFFFLISKQRAFYFLTAIEKPDFLQERTGNPESQAETNSGSLS